MRVRRSCLSVPARPARKLAKAGELRPDEVIVDLEDSVPAELKQEAREAVAAALADGDWAAAAVTVRINGAGTPWFEHDLRVLAAAGERLDSIVVPKVESAAELERVAELLAAEERAAGRERPIALQALIESARGLRDVNAIAGAAERLETLILGPADLSVSLGFPTPEPGERWDFVRGAIVVAARAAGIEAIDGPHLQISDTDGLVASARRAREFGFDGKWALHPAQVEPLNEVFSPTAAERGRAEAILAALADAPEQGAVLLDGEMVDEASRKRAELTLARSRAATATEAAP